MSQKKFVNWIKRHWKTLLLVLSAIVLLAANLCVLFFVRSEDNRGAWLTLFSGWVSGIATIALGVIAVVQNKKYKEENDSFMQRLKEENEALITRQTNQTVFNNIMNRRCNFIETVKQRLLSFIKDFDFRKVTLWLTELYVERNNTSMVLDDTTCAVKIQNFYKELEVESNDLLQFIINDWYQCEQKDQMVSSIKQYVEAVIIASPKDYSNIRASVENINKNCYNKFLELLEIKNKYITWLDIDFNMTLTTKTGDIEFIKSHYGYYQE